MVSIIVPVYNCLEYLDRCVESLRNQTLQDIEILLVDDGSTDSSAQVCEKHVAADHRVKYIHKKNGGVSSARNAGLEGASGEYVMFVDSDDRLMPEACELLLKNISQALCDCVICGIKQDTGNIWTFAQEREYDATSFKRDFPLLLETELLSVCFNKIYRRKLITRLFDQSMSFGEDLVFVLDYLENCQSIKIINIPLYLHNNLNESSLSHNFNTHRLLDIEKYQERIIRFYGKETDAVNSKYSRDIIRWLGFLFRSSLSYHDKMWILEQWRRDAHIFKMTGSLMHLSLRDRFMLGSLKINSPELYLLAVCGYRTLKRKK